MFLFIETKIVRAQKNKKETIKKIEVEISTGFEYDSNILKYSDMYIEKFKNSEDEGRFHVSSYDDLILYYSLKPSVTFEILKKRKTEVNFEFTRRAFLKNNIKTWNYFNIGISQNISKRANFKIFYSYIPYFYIRHYKDDDWINIYGDSPDTFQPFSFSKENISAWVQYTFFAKSLFRFNFSNSRYYYNEHFTEYDCTNQIYGIKLFQPLLKKSTVSIGYNFEISKTKELDKTIYTSDYADASYRAIEVSIGITHLLPEIWKFSNYLRFNAEYQNVYYTSRNYIKTDPFHTGRVDDKFNILIEYNIKVHQSIKLTAYYELYRRFLNQSVEINKDFLIEEKNYKQYQIGVQLTYNLNFNK
jgi:hypothetical protein